MTLNLATSLDRAWDNVSFAPPQYLSVTAVTPAS